MNDWIVAALAPIGEWWVNAGWPWISAWVQTSGFGGAAAVVAATIAFAGVRRQTRLNAWWQRAEWALELLSRDNASDEQVDMALEAIRLLRKSRLAKDDEQKFLAGIVTVSSLDPAGDGEFSDDITMSVAPAERPEDKLAVEASSIPAERVDEGESMPAVSEPSYQPGKKRRILDLSKLFRRGGAR